ncbi:MAG: hypothetical protein J1F32_00745 [Erysipelotrichales bacterium]|nr:hypothetical protein [Erysipelotrichales bacterium]
MAKLLTATQSNRKLINRSLIIGGFTTLMIVGGTLYFKLFTNLLPSKSDLNIETIYIRNADEFYAIYDKTMNDNYILLNDISLDVKKIKNPNNTFSGSFTGNGHTLTIKGKLDQSLFNEIDEGSNITDLHVFFTDISGVLSSDFGGISTYNKGKIDNCFIEYNTRVMLDNLHSFGGITAYNYGTIEKSIVKVSLLENPSYINNYTIGGLIGRNFSSGKLSNSVVMMNSQYLTNNLISIENNTVPLPCIGSAYGFNQYGDNENAELIYCEERSLPFIDREDKNIFYVSLEELMSKNLYLSTLSFNSQLWDINDGELPILIKNNTK